MFSVRIMGASKTKNPDHSMAGMREVMRLLPVHLPQEEQYRAQGGHGGIAQHHH